MAHAPQIAALLLPSLQKRTPDGHESAAQQTDPADHNSFPKQLQQAGPVGPKTNTADAHQSGPPTKTVQTEPDKKSTPTVQRVVRTKPSKDKTVPDPEASLGIVPFFPLQKTPWLALTAPLPTANKKTLPFRTTSLSPTPQQRSSLLLLQVEGPKKGTPTTAQSSEVWQQPRSALLMAKMGEHAANLEKGAHPFEFVQPKKESKTTVLRLAKFLQQSPALTNAHSRFSAPLLTQEITVVPFDSRNHDPTTHHGAAMLFAAQQIEGEPFWLSSTPASGAGTTTQPFAPQIVHSTTNTPIPVTHPSWPQQFTQNVAFLLRRGIPEAMISVHPRHLGPIKVRLTWENHVVHTSFFCHNDTTKQMIESSLPILQHMLLQTGVHLGQTNVSDQSQLLQEQQAFAAPHSAQPFVEESPHTALPTSGVDVFA